MTNAMVTRTVTPEIITAAAMLVRLAHHEDRSLKNGLAKAEQLLLSQPWTVQHGILMIASESCPTECRYSDGDTCDCKTNARYWCWHRAAFMVISTICAAGINPIAPLPLPLCVALDEDDDYPGDFLDQDFSSFEDASLTAPVAAAFYEVDMLPATLKRPAPFRLQPSRELGNPLDADVDRMFAAA